MSEPLTNNPDVRKLAERVYHDFVAAADDNIAVSRGKSVIVSLDPFDDLPSDIQAGWDAVAYNAMHGVYKHKQGGRVSRQGWRRFHCDECDREWKTPTRDHTIDSKETCINEYCALDTMPCECWPDENLAVDKWGNLVEEAVPLEIT